ncbi:hypothetical protein [Roseospira goensis]|uniref:Uncharacterized protein n=1 Tax=Roseospira goensis TaxID=391922 RepID=A0A7W6WIR9_9PROT|nr:hypothetical protein [Roseospira goensis]MBB4284506.1 hypothetical protein [Roseospira goensis]
MSLPLLSTPDGLHVQVGSEPDGQGLTMARQWVSDVTVPAAPARVFVQRLGAGPAEG